MKKDNSTIFEAFLSPEITTYTIGLPEVICGSGNKSMNEKDYKDGGFTEI